MQPCNPPSVFAGMTRPQLMAALANAQQAYLDLSTGAKGETYSYTQGDGAKSVTYTRANIANLMALIRQLQQELGIVRRARRPVRFQFT
ncbi:MAG TPA: gpW family head-tail joining protein [Rhizomicrobium sp.]|jgi:hypothetical protein|nr:gpW family head-tail joining protein [Rhizomicrobium sp.]